MLTAAAAAIVLVAAVSLTTSTRPVEAISSAVGQTLAFDSGTFSVERTVEAGERRLDQEISIDYRGDDFEIVQHNEGGILDETLGQITPAEFRRLRVGGVSFVGVDGVWTESPGDVQPLGTDAVVGPPSIGPMAERIEFAARAASTVERCSDSEPDVTSYCFATDDPALIAAMEPGSTAEYVSATAEVRVVIDDATGLLAAIHLDASNVVVDTSGQPGVTVPPIDRMTSVARFDDLGAQVTLEPPSIAPVDTDDVPWQCAGLEATLTIVDCLRHYGHDQLAEYYASLGLPPDPSIVIGNSP